MNGGQLAPVLLKHISQNNIKGMISEHIKASNALKRSKQNSDIRMDMSQEADISAPNQANKLDGTIAVVIDVKVFLYFIILNFT